MTTTGWLPAPTEELFGPDATAEEAYDVLTVDVPPAAWIPALETARDRLGCTYFDWLSAVDEPGTGFRVAAHVAALSPVRRLLLRTTVPHEAPALPTALGVYAGAGWHERETHEMFGVTFEGHPDLNHLLLPDGFEGHPLRKDFVLAARVAKAWPGAKEPGESEHGGPKRRQMLPPGVPDPNEWGPLKGQLPPAPSRPTRGATRGTGTATAAGAGAGAAPAERPPRRTRTAGQGSASQRPATEASAPEASAPEASAPESAAPAPRRARTASEGSASQRTRPTGPRRARSASEGSAGLRATPDAPARPTEPPAADPAPAPKASPRSLDAPWHHARPTFEEPQTTATNAPPEPAPPAHPDRSTHPDPPKPAAEPDRTGDPKPAAEPGKAEGPKPAAEPGRAGDPKPAAEPDRTDGPKPVAEPEKTGDPKPVAEPETAHQPEPATDPERPDHPKKQAQPTQPAPVDTPVDPDPEYPENAENADNPESSENPPGGPQ